MSQEKQPLGRMFSVPSPLPSAEGISGLGELKDLLTGICKLAQQCKKSMVSSELSRIDLNPRTGMPRDTLFERGWTTVCGQKPHRDKPLSVVQGSTREQSIGEEEPPPDGLRPILGIVDGATFSLGKTDGMIEGGELSGGAIEGMIDGSRLIRGCIDG